jgi:quercetin dioxygenase-like cupin family protein
MTINFDELAALEAAGALDTAETEAFEKALLDAPAAIRADVRELRELMAVAAGVSVELEAPPPHVKDRLFARLGLGGAPPPIPEGFAFTLATDDSWIPHAVPGIRMKMLSVNRERGYATLLMDVAPGARFPPHHHGGAEECYVISGSVVASGRRLVAGDFHHADAGSDHDELWTDEGCRVLLVVDPRDYMPQPSR